MQTKSKKRFLAAILAVAMAVSQMMPMTALADDGSQTTTSYVGDATAGDNSATSDATSSEKIAADNATTELKDTAPAETPAASGSEATSSDSSSTTQAPADPTPAPADPTPAPATPSPAPAEDTQQTAPSVEEPGLPPADNSASNAQAPLIAAGDPAIMEAATMANIRAGNTNYGNVTFARGEGQDNTIVIKVNENTRTYGEAYTKPGITVTLNGTEQSEGDVLKALNEGIVTMYATAEQDVRTPAGNYDVYVTFNLNNVTINETNYTILCGNSQLSKIHIWLMKQKVQKQGKPIR